MSRIEPRTPLRLERRLRAVVYSGSGARSSLAAPEAGPPALAVVYAELSRNFEERLLLGGVHRTGCVHRLSGRPSDSLCVGQQAGKSVTSNPIRREPEPRGRDREGLP